MVVRSPVRVRAVVGSCRHDGYTGQQQGVDGYAGERKVSSGRHPTDLRTVPARRRRPEQQRNQRKDAQQLKQRCDQVGHADCRWMTSLWTDRQAGRPRYRPDEHRSHVDRGDRQIDKPARGSHQGEPTERLGRREGEKEDAGTEPFVEVQCRPEAVDNSRAQKAGNDDDPEEHGEVDLSCRCPAGLDPSQRLLRITLETR